MPKLRLKSCWLAAGVLLTGASTVLAWGASGHKFVSGLAIEALSASQTDVPEFVRTKEAAALVAALSVELDRSRTAGRVHDEERDPSHYIGLDPDGTVFGVRPLTNLTRTREEFDTALRARGVTQYRSGYLPYAIVDGWQQLAKDFAYWRALTAIIEAPDTPAPVKAWAAADRQNRQMLTLRDIGVWSHYVGDASQPMHVSQHSDGWGVFPNPRALTQQTGIHARFESAFVRRHVTREMVAEKIKPYRACRCPFEIRVSNYLAESGSFLVATYELEKTGAFDVPAIPSGAAPPPATPAIERGMVFAAERIAAGAAELRDMIEDAWTASLDLQVGYPAVAVKAIVAKPSIATIDTFGAA